MENITKIEDLAFYNCYVLKHIDIQNVIDIGHHVFCFCKK